MKDIKDFKNKYGLSGLHSRPTSYMDFEDKTEEVFKDVELIISQTREETISEIRELLPSITRYKGEVVDINEENYRKEIIEILNKLKK